MTKQSRNPVTTSKQGRGPTSSSKTVKKKDYGGRTSVVVSLEDFAQRKGHVRALEEFHKRKQKKRVQTAKALRQYRKVMKREGFEAGTGASRKRGRLTNETNEEGAEEEDETPHMNDAVSNIRGERGIKDSNPTKKQRPKKSNPFSKSIQQAKDNKLQDERRRNEQEGRLKEKQKKLRERKEMTKKLKQRTKRGQPIIKNMMDNMLRKLEKQQTQTS